MRIERSTLKLLLCLASAFACHSNGSSPPVSNAFTLHYHRALGGYDGWTAQVTAGAVESSAAVASTDGFGAVYALTVKPGAAALSFTLAKGASTDDAGALSVDVSGSVREAWVFSGFKQAIAHALPAVPKTGKVALYYARPDKIYAGWGLHLWGDQVTNTVWTAPLPPTGIDPDLGAGFLIDIKTGAPAGNCPAGQICLIAHMGDTKDPGPDMVWDRSVLGDVIFLTSGSATLTSGPRSAGSISIEGAGAHLVAHDTVAWNVTDPAAVSFELRYSPTAAVVASDSDVTGGSTIALTPRPAGIGAALAAAMPQFNGWPAFDVAAADLGKLQDALRSQVVAVARNASGKPVQATQVQLAGVLDDLYAYDGALGVTFATVAGAPSFQLWAPTAQTVKLHVYDANKAEISGSPITMIPTPNGVWTASGPAGWYGNFYRYELAVYHPVSGKIETFQVTDPYSVNLSTNGLYSQIVDLDDPALRPAGWNALVKPPLASPTDIVVYEGHIRDFSFFDATVPTAERGRYLAFTETGSDGMKHLAALASAGLTHMHILPAFDFATVDEDPANRVDIDQTFDKLCAKNPAVPAATCTQYGTQVIKDVLAGLAGDSDQQTTIAGYLRNIDSFNWGYDPFHYGAPEGVYASTAEGTAKIVEFRRMVQGLAGIGLRLVMDVVYNHTNAAGPVSDKSVLDKVVPGYYHRQDLQTGSVQTSSCCADTATEHHMMGKLMVETVVRWARDYKVDGFRFDLMGLHLKADMLKVQAAVAALTPASDGVDGSKIYLYGEGWSEATSQARGVNATQANLAGTGIGTFNDRLRDGARGGGPFDNGCDLTKTPVACDIRKNQGFSTGLFLDPNELNTPPAQADQNKLGGALDLIKIGMAGGLADFRILLFDHTVAVPAGGLGYGGVPAGYTQLPQESINYVSSHDNQILWDIEQYKMPTGRTTADRVRADLLAMDVALLGEGIPFFHMGDDMLRSKSMDKNSYDSGDWFNRVDWTGAGNGWKSGLPNAVDDAANWTLARTIFADSSIAPGAADIALAAAHFQEMLKVRKSSRLFRLAAKSDVMTRVDFQNAGTAQTPGVIVMTVTDGTCAGADLDPARDALVVVVNADKASHTLAVPGASGFTLHPVQQASADATVKTATFSAGSFTVPARTTAVFEQPQAGAQGTGLPCNTR